LETRTAYTRDMSEPDWAPLTGFRVAVTSARRADELSALLRRRGAAVTSAAAITMVPLPDDDELRAYTEALIDSPPDIVIATTGIGFRGWVAAADGWGLANELITALSKARILSRGPKATGSLRAARLPEEWSPESESSRELLHYLLEGGIAGQRIAVQLHGATDEWDPFPEFLDELRAAGAEVVPIRVYRWHPAPRNGDFDQLVAGIAEEKFDAVSFTSAPAVASVLMRAAELGIADQVLSALRTGVHAMCVGPVTARPLVRLGVPTSAPERMRLGALARHITDELPLLQSRTVRVAGHLLEIRGTCVLVDGVVKAVSPAGMATIRALAHRPGAVVSRGDLLGALPGSGTDTHAVETAVLRLRTALGDKNIVATVVKRGYRLAVDEELTRAL
jgi:uroporphyrinogen-III synthase